MIIVYEAGKLSLSVFHCCLCWFCLFVSWVLLSFVLWIFSGNRRYSHGKKGLSHACIGENVSRTVEAEFLSLEFKFKTNTRTKAETKWKETLWLCLLLICSSGFNSFLYNHLHLQPSSGIVTPVLSCIHVTAPIFCPAIVRNNLLLLSTMTSPSAHCKGSQSFKRSTVLRE